MLTRAQEVDSTDSINQIVLNRIAGRNINTHNNQIMTFNLNGYYGPYQSDAIALKMTISVLFETNICGQNQDFRVQEHC